MLADLPSDKINNAFDKWIRTIYKSQKAEPNNAIIIETATYLSEAVSKGFEKAIYTEPDVRMVHSLLTNTWQFAGMKTYAQAQDISLLLVDNDGKPRSFDAFKKEAAKVGTIYNQNWLRTEYQHAFAASQAASKWVDIKAGAKAFPLLQYDTAGDNRVRASHAALDGITLPIDNPFWQIHYPPWEWACRCTVRQLAGGKTTSDGKVKEQQEEAGPSRFKNIGTTGKAFPEDMPFFKADAKTTQAINDIVSKISAESIKEVKIALKQQVYAMSIDKQYQTLDTFDNGGKVMQHVLVNRANMRDWDDVYGIAKIKASAGELVKIQPEINFQDKAAREKLMPGAIGYSNADLLVNGKLEEVEKTSQYANIASRIASGAKQANRVILIYDKPIDKITLGKNTKNLFSAIPTLEHVEIYNSNFKKIADLKPPKIKKGK